MLKLGEKYLITTNDWFVAPDGQTYKSVFGEVESISDAKDMLGIATNRNSTNWYVVISGVIIAGCQIHYAVKTDKVDSDCPYIGEYNCTEHSLRSRIYNAIEADD